MQAILTKFLPPTNHRGARIVAKCDAKRIVVAWDYALNTELNHREAAHALAMACGWDGYGEWHGGSLPGSSGDYAWTCATGQGATFGRAKRAGRG